ncbi:Cof-type HAD-IIB family hydrolase [Convivina praedatoris]|uniref:5-amino-6-(5-phospho-D-ribitylamino)uracil phosphatase YbjI n=1 Tax=Convivina praedatoris TaxID=2880963 RepID=A0ABM9D244_9LACO|nr:Cof-type HAD-IIB family hydrolase [Convivina sp. LMG 32447]CAH1852399.1 5-amino-6-(5-phospho-D-ribitylamino)uracil phosphatase YbjI [Convivina sp. LMG 32447]CAH1852438.1 5-amino-6-(5-phospho-D-ribitylamino)uracil phosphatase YbjI [Convivina sp. LMG 32447]CAH1855166.1 5-amino-6-(5-phospho-D-ribitylamino)uracil phosphatase YbjI [Convivina sp. LMG 32447]
MTIKMIATDMDGTFLKSDDNYDIDYFERVLAALQKKDIRFVAASGRQIANLRTLFKPVIERGGQIDYVASNGSIVATHEQDLYSVYLSAAQIQKVIDWNAANPDSADNLIILSGNHGTYISNHATGQVKKMVEMFYPNVHQVEKLMEIDDKIIGVTFVWPHEEVREHVEALEKIFGDELHATGSGFGSVDILPKGVNKATALEVLQDYYNILDDEIMVFGDNTNDLEMLQKYAHHYLMPNADAFMKEQITQEATAPNTDNGVIKTIIKELNLDI